jgi:RNA-binding protein
MEKLTGGQRRRLRALAHHLKPVVMIGKGGLTEAVLAGLDQALSDHELVKLKFLDFKDQKEELAGRIETALSCEQVGQVGHVVIFYRLQPDPVRRKIALPEKSPSD